MKKTFVLGALAVTVGVAGWLALNASSLASSTMTPSVGAPSSFNSPTGSAQLTEHFLSLDDIAKATPTVITGQVAGESEKFEYHDVTFVKTQIKIKDVYRDIDGLEKGDTITLLQTYVEEDPIVDKNDEILLFLKKYKGPVTTDAYRIVGLMQGHYKLQDELYVAKKEDKTSKKGHSHEQHTQESDLLQKASTGFTIEEITSVLEQVKYQPATKSKQTAQEDKEEEEKRKQIMEELENSGKLGDNK
ncbi:hypothetical protein [Brevibacillus reuszeri]|uniref:hypothetical protein n=1 Tax=Brevibacillus reuszeri TaxID=54915 RepID=UPI003D1A6E57